MFPYRIVAAGDAALVVEFPQKIDPTLNAFCIAVADAIERRCGSALRDAVVGYCTVTVYFDPLRLDAAWMEEQIHSAIGGLADVEMTQGALVEVPVSYGGEHGPDLVDVARFGNCAEEEVIALHTQ